MQKCHLGALFSCAAVLTMAIHVLQGGMCWSPTISAVVHAHLMAFPVVQLTSSLFVVNGLATAAGSAHFFFFDVQSEVRERIMKLRLVYVLGLANVLGCMCWLFAQEITGGIMLAAALVNEPACLPHLHLHSGFACYDSCRDHGDAHTLHPPQPIHCKATAIQVAWDLR